ncbi:MAG: PE family protein, partial [Alphaproteobacteria bacterium HGW-Alphaproteobacteria-13]
RRRPLRRSRRPRPARCRWRARGGRRAAARFRRATGRNRPLRRPPRPGPCWRGRRQSLPPPRLAPWGGGQRSS